MQESLHITYWGQATVLIRVGDVAILTDPYFSDRLLGSRRRDPMTADPATLPELSTVCLSHAHRDHLDASSFRYIRGTVPTIVPVGCGATLHPFVRNPILELAHWITHPLAEGLGVTAVPVRHPGGRLIPGLRTSQCNGYILQVPGWTIYFAGDSAYGTHFAEVGHLYEIDVALLPLGGRLPRWLSPTNPLSPAEWLRAGDDLRATTCIPIHWGTFPFSGGTRRHIEALDQLAVALDRTEQLQVLEPGQSFDRRPVVKNPPSIDTSTGHC
jgi:L-ascorbate metabolism protein UlaG (beta-lactamase superfamily)